MGYLIFFGAIIALGIFISKRTKQKQRENQYRAIILGQVQRETQILNESLKIIENTKNLSTLKSRVDVILQVLDRMKGIERQGYRFTDKSSDYIRDNAWGVINDRIMELAQKDYQDLIDKKGTYSSIKLLVNALGKLQGKLIDYKKALYSDDENIRQKQIKITEMIEKIDEEKIIGQLKEIIEKADKEEFKGNIKKARNLYLEALHFYQNNGGEKYNFATEIKRIEQKVNVM